MWYCYIPNDRLGVIRLRVAILGSVFVYFDMVTSKNHQGNRTKMVRRGSVVCHGYP